MIAIFLIVLLTSFVVKAYDQDQSKICVYLSGAAYCGKDKYKTMQLSGPASGFVYEDTLYDVKTDLQGFVGYLSSKKTIYVSLRGSSSVLNWLDDAEVKLVDYTSWPTCSCKVHYGFYRSAEGVKNKTIETVKLLKKRFPMYSVIMTGHSYGASTVQLLGMELQKSGINVEIYNYGQPRIGDAKYAGFVNTIIEDYWRFTHNKDMVPHVPPISGFGYLHSCREVFEDGTGKLNICSEANCEDPKCADQYSLTQTNTDDHSYYLGHRVDCANSVI
jgi:Lipase (class 3)